MSHEKYYCFSPALTVTCRGLVTPSLTFLESWWLQESLPLSEFNRFANISWTLTVSQTFLVFDGNSLKIIQGPSQPQAHDVPFLRAVALFIFGHSSDLWDISSPFRDWTQDVIVKAPNRNHWVPREFPWSISFRKITTVNPSSVPLMCM